MKHFHLLLLLIFCCLQSCHKQTPIPAELRYIDSTMNNNPQEALLALDSLEHKYNNAPERVRMKHTLLKVKAGDKAYILQTSDSTMRKLVEYYDKHGSRNERMEAYYYLGCAYRDLHDSPKTIKNYHTAIDLADTTQSPFDWYTYATIKGQLAGLYERQFNYEKAIELQKCAVQIRKEKGLDSLYAMCRLGSMYENADSVAQADFCYGKILSLILKNGVSKNDLKFLGTLLGFYARNHLNKQIEQCRSMIHTFSIENWPVNTCSNMGDYYEQIGKNDSALFYYTYADKLYGPDLYRRKSSLKNLYRFHLKIGNEREAMHYAQLYIAYSDSVEKDRATEQTAQADNMYQYWKNEEEQMAQERATLKNRMIIAYCLAGFFVAVLATITIVYFYKRRLKRISAQYSYLQQEKNELQNEVNNSHQQMNALITRQEKERNQQSQITISLSEIVHTFKLKANKSAKVTDNKLWKTLFNTVESNFPGFKNSLLKTYGEIDIKYLKFIYLRKVGFNKSTAATLLGTKRSTVNYWCNKLQEQGGGLSVEDFINQ